MKQIKILHLVFSYDLKNKNTYILSTNSDDIIVPYSIIDKPIFIQEQIKTTILGFFLLLLIISWLLLTVFIITY